MKNSNLFLSALIITFLSTCTVGVNKDLLTGLSYSYKGLSVEDAYLAVNNEKLKSNELKFGSQAYIFITGVEGYKTDDGRVRIGCSIELTDADGVVVLSTDDAFAAYDEEGIDPEQAKVLNVSLTIGTPIEPGKEYNWKSHFWDKGGEGTIDTGIKIKILSAEE